MEAISKAYGKILLFGAYSVLEPGNVGLVVNIDKGTTATVQETDTGKIVIDLSNFEIIVHGTVEDSRLKMERDPEVLKFIKNAVDCSFQYLNYMRQKIKDIRLISFNDPEMLIKKGVKTGLGSSATSTVAAVSAILKLHDIDDRDAVYKIARYAHYKSQGNTGSGFDVMSACYGSNFFISELYNPMEGLIPFIESGKIPEKETFQWPSFLTPLLIFTGTSASTEELVKKVKDYKDRNFGEYKDFMFRYNEINLALKSAFSDSYVSRLKFFLEESWKMRRELGRIANAPIEPEKYTLLMEEMKSNGAITAGLIGAGGGDSIIALCKDEADRDHLQEFLSKRKITYFDNLNIINQGYELIR